MFLRCAGNSSDQCKDVIHNGPRQYREEKPQSSVENDFSCLPEHFFIPCGGNDADCRIENDDDCPRTDCPEDRSCHHSGDDEDTGSSHATVGEDGTRLRPNRTRVSSDFFQLAGGMGGEREEKADDEKKEAHKENV